MEFIDSHAHLEYDYPFSVEEYLERARRAGVTKVITIGTDAESLTKIPNIAEKNENVFFTIGLHPHEAKDYNSEFEATMQALHSHPKCVAVGEIGLDYHYDHSPREEQQKVCARQLALAAKWKLPVVIHSRDGEDDLLELLKAYVALAPDKSRVGAIHCFSGSAKFAKETLALGFYISFSGIVTFKKAEDLREIAASVPLDRILLETDSPYLAPMPHRGKKNESALLPHTAQVVAVAKGIAVEELAKATSANTVKLFDL